jgi:chemotaxis protein MotB
MRKERGASQENKNTFTVLMTSLSVILLAFFILLNTYAVMDIKKTKKAIGSLSGTFGILPGGFRSEKGETVLPTWTADMGIEGSMQSLEEFFRETGNVGSLLVSETDEGLVINIADQIFFSAGRAELRSDGLAALDAIAEIIKTAGMPFRIGGHTDDIPVHNQRFASNWELSAARASKVLRYFIERWEIPATMLSAVGYGEHQPLVPNTTDKNRAKNRRVSIVLLKKPNLGDSPLGDFDEKEIQKR